MYSVYMHKFPNGKVYVGITSKPLEERWGTDGRNYRSQFVYKAIQKYGWDNIDHICVADGLTDVEACALEIELISKYNATSIDCGYNCTTGGEKSYDFSEETRHRLSESHLGHKLSQEHIDSIVQAHLGVPRTDEVKRKISDGRKKYLSKNPINGSNNPFFGKHHSEKTIEKIREAKLGKPAKSNKKATLVSYSGEVITFNRQCDIAEFLGVSQALVSKAIKNGYKIKNYRIERI